MQKAARFLLRMAAFAVVTIIGAENAPFAQKASASETASPQNLIRHPEKYIDKTVTWANGYCFFDNPAYVCVGKDTPFEVIASSIPAGPLKDAIETNCSGLDGIERNPLPECSYSFQFAVKSYQSVTGDYVLHGKLQRQRHLIQFQANELAPAPQSR